MLHLMGYTTEKNAGAFTLQHVLTLLGGHLEPFVKL